MKYPHLRVSVRRDGSVSITRHVRTVPCDHTPPCDWKHRAMCMLEPVETAAMAPMLERR